MDGALLCSFWKLRSQLQGHWIDCSCALQDGFGAHVKHAAGFIQTRRGLESVAYVWMAHCCAHSRSCGPRSRAIGSTVHVRCRMVWRPCETRGRFHPDSAWTRGSCPFMGGALVCSYWGLQSQLHGHCIDCACALQVGLGAHAKCAAGLIPDSAWTRDNGAFIVCRISVSYRKLQSPLHGHLLDFACVLHDGL